MKNKRKTIITVAFSMLLLMLTACDDSYDSSIRETTTIKTYDTKIIVDYDKVLLTTNNPLDVYVDDVCIAENQEAGSKWEYYVNLKEGEHEIYLKADTTLLNKTDTLKFNVNQSNTEFNFKTKINILFGIDFCQE